MTRRGITAAEASALETLALAVASNIHILHRVARDFERAGKQADGYAIRHIIAESERAEMARKAADPGADA